MIEDYSFGRIIIQGKEYRHDLKIIQDKVMPDWWRKEGHRLAMEDIRDILSATPTLLIIGTGHSNMMRVPSDVKQRVSRQKIKLIDLPTSKAVALFNTHFLKGDRVAAGFHLTC